MAKKTKKADVSPRAMVGSVPVWCVHDKIVDCIELVMNPKNPNTHPAKQIALLGKIISKQGWRLPITVSKRSGFIVKGHGRLEAAFKVGIEKAPVDYQDYESEAAESADMVADNQLCELSEFNNDKLSEILSELKVLDIDMELTGFDLNEIDSITNLSIEDSVSQDSQESVVECPECGAMFNPKQTGRV